MTVVELVRHVRRALAFLFFFFFVLFLVDALLLRGLVVFVVTAITVDALRAG